MNEPNEDEREPGHPRVSRRIFLTGVAGISAAAGLARAGQGVVRPQAASAATAPSGPPTTTLPLPTTTDPEQLLLTWGADPATSVTVSWFAPGTVAQPAPTLRYSTKPITEANPGHLVKLPDPKPLDVTERYEQAASVSFADGLNGQTTYAYHAQLTGLRPGTRYFYEVSDGSSTPATAGSSFATAPAGRARYRFSSYGDLATPSWVKNASGNIWHESCDNSYYAVSAIEDPGDGRGAPLFHLLNGDLCYANLDIFNAPGVWRDFGINVARSSANRPWMPALGNHETEFGTCDHAGHPGTAPGGIAAQAAAGNYWNGPYGYGHYLTRFLLPDNGVTNHDGNHLRGNFYSFRVGTVAFLSLDADDVIYQDGASAYLNATANAGPEVTSSGVSIPNGTVTYNHGYTGDLAIEKASNSAVPDYSHGRPNLQLLWLERTLAQYRRDAGVDMIVVFMHQCAMSTSAPGNGPDQGGGGGHPHAHGGADHAGPGQRHPGLEHPAGHGVPGAGRGRHQRPDQHLRRRHRGQPPPSAGQGDHREKYHHRLGGGGLHPQRGRLGRGRGLVGLPQRDRRLRVRDLRRGPGPRARRDHDHPAVLRHPGGQQRSGYGPRRHHHAAVGAGGDVRVRPQGQALARTSIRDRPSPASRRELGLFPFL
jgi:hypothetical protein